MAFSGFGKGSWLLALCLVLVILPGKAQAFGAGNIPSIAQVEGHNWRHGDIEDMLESIAFLHGKKWTSLLIGRVYFGNWLRDYSQAIDVGSLKGCNAATIRILVWVLSFLAHGYATDEFEVTEERLGCYRPEEHIDNPRGYAEGMDARELDSRLRGPVEEAEIEIDPETGMKNYIKNESGGWATSAGYLRFSIGRSIHFGRLYTNGADGQSGREEDLCEALRCLGQALHTIEDFPAHSNYCELALRELGYHDVFSHCGEAAVIDLNGSRVYPLVTGTFGAVDFIHSVLGEANDHFTQSEVDEMNQALINAQGLTKENETRSRSGSTSRGFLSSALGGSSQGGGDFISLVGQLPGIGDGFAREAKDLQRASAAQQEENTRSAWGSADNQNVVPGMSESFDPVKTAGRIYPILQFRDRIVKAINRFISKVPGLEKLLEHISETLTAFILGLLAPFIQPIVQQVSKVLKDGSSGLLGASANSQYEPWDNPICTDPTHSMLSKDHFTNVLNSACGRIAVTMIQYAVPRILYAWENPGVPIEEVVDDILQGFHHPAARDESVEIQRNMFNTVREWANNHPRRHELPHILSSESVKNGKNHILNQEQHSDRSMGGPGHSCGGGLGHSKTKRGLWKQIQTRDLGAMEGQDNKPIGSASIPSTQQDFGYRDDGGDKSHHYTGDSGGGEAASFYNDAPPSAAPPPQHSYGGPPPGQWPAPSPYGAGAPPPGPPPGHYGGPTPPGPGYGGPPPPGPGYQYGQPPPPQGYPYPPQGYAPRGYPPQQPPPPGGGWSGYPGQYRY